MKLSHLYICPFLEIDPKKWNIAADNSDDAWIWHQSSAIDGYSTWNGYTDISFAVLNSEINDTIVALIPLHKVKTIIPFFNRLESTGGPAYVNSLQLKERKAISQIINLTLKELSKTHNASRIDLSLSPLSPTIRSARWPMVNPLISINAHETSTMSWLVDLANISEDELWKKVAHRTRKAVKKAKNNHYTVREATKSDIDEYMRLHKTTAERNNLPQKPRSYARNIFDNLIPNGQAKIFLAEKNGRVEAFHSFAIYKQAANYWTTGCTTNALRDGVNNFLLWEAMCALKASNILWLECGESLPNSNNEKLQRINDFKRSFGGKLYPYYRGSIITHPILESVLAVLRAIKLRAVNQSHVA